MILVGEEVKQMSVFDFHSHILPGIDDGSRNIETSINMINKLKESGVEIIVATPHFYADKDRVDTFVNNREVAYEDLMEIYDNDMPKLLLGAEVAFFKGISKAEKLSQLLIEGTNAMLLELPFTKWDESVINELEYLIHQRKITIILAHLERYMGILWNKPYIKKIFEMPVYIQINAESLIDAKRRNSVLKLFKKEQAHLLGSDCHGMHHRAPNLREGRDIIEDKLGREYLDKIDKLGASILGV